MRAQIDLIPESLAQIGWSYGDMRYGNYGVCVWEYAGGFWGPVRWINWEMSCYEPEYSGAQAFHYYFKPGVQGVVQVVPTIQNKVPDIVIGDVPTNLLVGKGVPIRPPH